MINAIYNMVEETLSWEEIDRLISELKTLRDYKLDEEKESQIWDEASKKFRAEREWKIYSHGTWMTPEEDARVCDQVDAMMQD